MPENEPVIDEPADDFGTDTPPVDEPEDGGDGYQGEDAQ